MFEGSMVALITPFKKDLSVDEERLRALVDFHVENNTDVIVPCGTTGESATLSHEEHDKVVGIVLDQVKGKVRVVAGAGSNSTAEAVSLSRHAKDLGVDGVLSVSPYYNKPTQEGLYQHYKSIAEKADVPVIVYNVPGRTGKNIEAGTTLRLAELPNVVAIKEASGNLSQIMEIIRCKPKGFNVLSGDDSLAFPLIALGGKGCISVAANIVPELFSEMIHSALEGNYKKAVELHYRLLPLFEAEFIETNPIPIKCAVALSGRVEENYRLPLVPMAEHNKEKMAQVLRGLKVI